MGGWLESVAASKAWDRSHEAMTTGFNETIERLDRLFGDERLDEDTRDSWLRTRVGLRQSEREGLSMETRIRLRLVMPQLERRLQLVVDEISSGGEGDASGALAESARASETDAALRLNFGEGLQRLFSFDVGARASGPQAFLRSRFRLTSMVGDWELRLTETATYFSSEGLESVTEARWTLPFGERDRWLFRSTSQAIWEEERRSGVTPFQSVSLIRELSERRAYRVELSGLWPEAPHTREANYAAEFTYRQRLHRWWLFGEAMAGVEFPQIDGHEPGFLAALRFEVILGQYRQIAAKRDLY